MFDPNKSIKLDIWATYIPARRPKFKIHYKKSHATSALKTAGYSEHNGFWKYENGMWVQIKIEE